MLCRHKFAFATRNNRSWFIGEGDVGSRQAIFDGQGSAFKNGKSLSVDDDFPRSKPSFIGSWRHQRGNGMSADGYSVHVLLFDIDQLDQKVQSGIRWNHAACSLFSVA